MAGVEAVVLRRLVIETLCYDVYMALFMPDVGRRHGHVNNTWYNTWSFSTCKYTYYVLHITYYILHIIAYYILHYILHNTYTHYYMVHIHITHYCILHIT